MADKATCLLMNLPLEVRHTIFEYSAARDVKPKKLLRYWFEKKEAKELVAQQVAANPSAPAPRVMHNNEYEEDSDVAEQESNDMDSDDEDGEDGENDGDGEYEDEAEDDEIVQDHDEDEAEDDEIVQDHDEDEDEDEAADEGDDDDEISVEQTMAQPLAQVQNVSQPPPSQATQAQIQGGNTNQQLDEAEMDDEDDDELEAQGGETAAQDQDGDEVMAEDSDDDAHDDENATGTVAAPPPPPVPVVHVSRKWRYIPNFMRITHCPPPVELLLASKQLNQEAKDWFYDVAILRINATGSFAHTSFFEEAFRQITEAAFSPMENVRKVEATFVWDTTWLRADNTGCAEAIFPALLRQRSDFVYQILAQAPDLKEVTIHWHDSAQDDESANFMLDILAPFHSLSAIVKIKEHYIAADAKPHKRSIAGQRRVEFQSIVDAGLERLF